MVVSILEVIERGNKINLTEIDLSILIQENVNEEKCQNKIRSFETY